MGVAEIAAARRREWTRIAHDALHELETLRERYERETEDEALVARLIDEMRGAFSRVHEALHNAVDDDPTPAETAASDLRPFDRGFVSLAREHGVAAMWIAAVDGRLLTGGHVDLNRDVSQIIHAGMAVIGQGVTPAQPEPDSGLWTPGPNGRGLIMPGEG